MSPGPARENTALKNMTEAEKEVEANRLINLIDDMHRKVFVLFRRDSRVPPANNMCMLDFIYLSIALTQK